MTTHLYIDLLTPEEKLKRGKGIKKPPIKGLLPLEKTKVAMMRHVNEVELLRKIQSGLTGKKNVRFKAETGDMGGSKPSKKKSLKRTSAP
jgi:hypothetical protein